MHVDLPKTPNWDELMKQQRDMPFYPSTPNYLGNKSSTDSLDATALTMAQLQADLYSKREKTIRENEHVAAFKETYIKLRTDNIVLDHQTAIELAKMIYSEADTITYEDTQ